MPILTEIRDQEDAAATGPNAHPSPPWKCLHSVRSNIETNSGAVTAPYAKFYEDWWRTSDRLDGEIIKVAQPELWDELNLDQSKGSMIVREEFKYLYERLLRLPASITGALVTGQNGICKSYFGTYMVLRRMAQGKNVLFTTSFGETYLIDEDGILYMEEKYFNPALIPSNGEGRIWSILISASLNPPDVTVLSARNLFGILISPAIEDLYTHWSRQDAVQEMVVNPWTIDEIKTLFSTPKVAPVALKPEMDVEMLVAIAGLCPGDIFEFLYNPGAFWDDLEDAIRCSASFSAISRLLHSQDDSDLSSRHLTLVRRPRVESGKADSLKVDFKARAMGQAVFRRALKLSRPKPGARLDNCLALKEAGVNPELAGGIFEQLAHWCIGDAASSPIHAEFDDLIPMRATPGHAHIFKCVGRSKRLTGDVEIDWDRKTKFKLIADKTEGSFKGPGHEQQQHLMLFFAHRKICLYDSLEKITLKDDEYYIYTLLSNSLFDSFFLEKTKSSVVLWLLQIAVARDYSWFPEGVPILKSVIDKAKVDLRVPNVELKYVLVVPGLQGLTATWKWHPDVEKWRDIAGEVFLQPLMIGLVPFESIFRTE